MPKISDGKEGYYFFKGSLDLVLKDEDCARHPFNMMERILTPGAGKALVAKTLAKKLGWQFIDANFDLEFRVGDTFQDILGRFI